MSKKRTPEQYETVFEALMTYARKNTGEFKGKTDHELWEYLKEGNPDRVLDRQMSGAPSRQYGAFSRTNGWRDLTTREQAVKTELSRNPYARRADERVTAKDSRRINQENYRAWKRNPQRIDLYGIDTATHSYIRQEANRKLNTARTKGYTDIKRRGGDIVGRKANKKGKLELRSILTGRYA